MPPLNAQGGGACLAYLSSLNRWRDTWTTTDGKDSPPSQNQADTPTNKGTSRRISSVANQFPALTSPGGTDTNEAHPKRTSGDLQTKDDYIEPSQRQPNFEQHTNAQITGSRAASTSPGPESTSDEEMSQGEAGPKEEVWYDAPQNHD